MERIAAIQTETAAIRPNYRSLGGALLEEVRKFFADPEMEAEFQEWKKARETERKAN